MEDHHYRIGATWVSGRTGIAKCESVPNALRFSAPPHFGGVEGKWTPEDLLLTALASCYTSTFRALADYSKFEYADLEVEVAGNIQKRHRGYVFSEMLTRPALSIIREKDHQRALRLLEKTHELCLVRRALAVKHSFEPRIQVIHIPAPLMPKVSKISIHGHVVHSMRKSTSSCAKEKNS
jgi:organic hydroperoxide reductase OsmC/OhrA